MDNTEIVKKSIFRQKTYAVRYHLEYMWPNYVFTRERRAEVSVDSSNNLVSDDEIFVCNLEMPLLEKGEEFYIEEQNLLVKIESRCRSSLGSVTYYVEPNHITDDESKKSFEELHKYKELYKKYNDLENKYNKAFDMLSWWNKKKLTK